MNDEEKDELQEAGEETEGESFAELLEQSLGTAVPLEPGQQVSATVLKIGAEWVFLDVGQKGEGVLDKAEILDAEGVLAVVEGETIEVYFLSRAGGELRFTRKVSGSAGRAQLEEAFRAGIPVEGTVAGEIKGGFEIRLAGGARGFCPFSQIDLRRAEESAGYIDKSFAFRITRYEEQGRNLVLSRRALLEEEREQARQQLRETLREGMTVRGTVTSIRDFGAFVDIGGIEGLLPISEIGWGRVEDIHAVLDPGQEVEVVITRLDWEENRFSFSLKQALADPWERVQKDFLEGSVHKGRVARLAPFGAFVTLGEGIDGLVHISQLGEGRRINHPREVVGEGEEIEVRVEKIDLESRRISLAPAAAVRAAEEEAQENAAFHRRAEESSSGMGTLGDLLKVKQKGRKKKQ